MSEPAPPSRRAPEGGDDRPRSRRRSGRPGRGGGNRGGAGGRGGRGEQRRRLSPEQVERRAALVPKIRYPEELPVSQRRDDIAAAIRDHQVVIVAGETGSGKTTQLPKICLELGRGVHGLIGHTQPRRIAARSVAERIAEELGTELGEHRRLPGAVHRPRPARTRWSS